MLIDLERHIARSCRQSDDGGFSAAGTHFHTLKLNLFVIRPFASPINEWDFAGYCPTATSMSFGSRLVRPDVFRATPSCCDRNKTKQIDYAELRLR
jgi:hypothetical protein